jgi:hypothetical protein
MIASRSSVEERWGRKTYCWVFGGGSKVADIPGERKTVYLVSNGDDPVQGTYIR